MRFINAPRYPTKEEILKVDIKIKPVVLDVVLSWKKEFLSDWKNTPKDVQIGRLKVLILSICVIGYSKYLNVKEGKSYCYDPKQMTVYQDKDNPSILSALHEAAHHLFGKSELKACRWSIKLFKTCFPGLFNKLHWKGHLLIK